VPDFKDSILEQRSWVTFELGRVYEPFSMTPRVSSAICLRSFRLSDPAPSLKGILVCLADMTEKCRSRRRYHRTATCLHDLYYVSPAAQSVSQLFISYSLTNVPPILYTNCSHGFHKSGVQIVHPTCRLKCPRPVPCVPVSTNNISVLALLCYVTLAIRNGDVTLLHWFLRGQELS